MRLQVVVVLGVSLGASLALALTAHAQQRHAYTLPFDAGSTKVNAKAGEVVAKALAQIKTCADNGVRVVGHTDRSTSDEQSSTLATERARAVKDYLVAKGILDSRISWVGRSENEPAVATADGVKEAKNNRVEIILVCD